MITAQALIDESITIALRRYSMEDKVILVINPGSTSTKIAAYRGTDPVFINTIHHSVDEISAHRGIEEQYTFRKKIIFEHVEKHGISQEEISIIIGRGGLLNPIRSGVYAVNDIMIEHLKAGWQKSLHGANLAGIIANDMASEIPGALACIADPPVVDELGDLARVSGHPQFQRKSIFHALNQKAVSRKHAENIGRDYEDLNLIVVHLGGGISVGAHMKGMIVDVNNAMDGEGPFSPERSGTLPAGDLARLCFSGEYTHEEVRRMFIGEGGITAYLQTNDAREVESMIDTGDSKASLIYEAMIYQVAKDIGAMFTVLKGDVDAVILTGGIAHSSMVTEGIIERIGKLAPVHIYPGEDEMEALAMNGLRVMRGETEILEYH